MPPTPVCSIYTPSASIKKYLELPMESISDCLMESALRTWAIPSSAKIWLELLTSSMNPQCKSVFMSPLRPSNPAQMMLAPTIRCFKMPATGYIPSSSTQESESGSPVETLTIVYPLLAPWPGFLDLETTKAFLLRNSGGNGGFPDSTNTRTKLEGWYGNWEDLLLHQWKEQDTWCPKTKESKLILWWHLSWQVPIYLITQTFLNDSQILIDNLYHLYYNSIINPMST